MQCPYCKEEIIDDALKCKHCGSLLGDPPALRETGGQNDFGAMFGRAFELWKGDMGNLALVTLVFLLVVWIPVVNVAFIAGFTRSLLKVARGQGRAAVGDIFDAWDCFGNLLGFVLINLLAYFILHFVPILGPVASLVLGFVVMPGGYLIIDRGKGVVDAYKWCLETIQADFVNWLLAYLVASVISCAGFVLLLVGSILSIPLGQLIVIQQYEAAAKGYSSS